MAEHTKIIEFFGSPGCGKTTLCNQLKANIEKKGLRASILQDETKICSWYHIIFALKFSDVLLFLRWFLFINKSGHTSRKIGLAPIKRIFIYRCAIRFSISDYVFIEHGICQSVVSFLYGASDPIHLLNDPVFKILFKDDLVDAYIYCDVPNSELLKRIRIRNRKTSGRLDKMEDTMLLNELAEQKKQFEKLCCIMSDLESNVFHIDNNDNIEKSVMAVEEKII